MQGFLTVERYAADPEDVERASASIWAELAFDKDALAALRRDGLMLDGARLTGPSPFIVRPDVNDRALLTVSVDEAHQPEQGMLLDLWHVYFMKRVHLEPPSRRQP